MLLLMRWLTVHLQAGLRVVVLQHMRLRMLLLLCYLVKSVKQVATRWCAAAGMQVAMCVGSCASPDDPSQQHV